MKIHIARLLLLGFAVFFFSFSSKAQEDWPKVITASDGTIIKVYQPEPESLSGNVLKFRSAISVSKDGNSDPAFGTFWSTSKVETDRDNRQIAVESIDITDIKVPAITDPNRMDFIEETLESQIPQAVGQIPLDDILTSLDQNKEEAKLSNNINTKAPKVIYTTQPSILVLIDGNPKLQKNNDWGVDVVVNSPFTIVKNDDGRFYLYGGHHWYTASSATGPYAYASTVPQNLSTIETALNKNANASNGDNDNNNTAAADNTDNVVSNIVVSTSPAELIQSKGEPNFSPIEGTSLLYVKNSNNDIFMDVNSQQYFVLISGRWYKTKTLNSNQWQFIPADKLPADFAKIPEGAPKDNVLASVAGTDAAREAVMDAQIPQTAKVDRNTATTTVTYNGNPEFRSINGTHLQYAVNTSSTVLRYKGRFYAVDNGVWFISDSPTGPWVVSTERPDEVDAIPPDYPVYNTKYVYVYDVSPDYVYMGYTPGYLNSFVYGPTVVYGTGFYYDPWWGSYYYPRPWSWGFNIGYNPWYGWSFGFGYGLGWFSGYGGYSPWGWYGGWWGPSFYHPAYCGWYGGGYGGYHGYGGYYGRNASYYRHYGNVYYNNNIYRNRGGVVTRDNARYIAGNNRPGRVGGGNGGNSVRPGGYNRPMNTTGSNRSSGRPSVFSDRQGNVYQRGGQGWQQRNNRQWAPVNNNRPDVIRNLDRQQQMRDRGETRSQNFERARSFNGGGNSFSRPAPSNGGGASFSRPAPSGGGGRSFGNSGGGGGGGSRPSGGGGGGGGGGSRPGRR
jgi:hypothetical protein